MPFCQGDGHPIEVGGLPSGGGGSAQKEAAGGFGKAFDEDTLVGSGMRRCRGCAAPCTRKPYGTVQSNPPPLSWPLRHAVLSASAGPGTMAHCCTWQTLSVEDKQHALPSASPEPRKKVRGKMALPSGPLVRHPTSKTLT